MINVVKQVLLLTIIFAVVGVVAVAFSRSTQYVATGADVPPDMVCIVDTFPDMYMCSYDKQPSWLKTKENYHD